MKMHKARTFLRVVAVLAVAVTGGKLAQAQSCNVSWTGNAGNGAWSMAGNWSTNQVPGPTSDVCISNAAVDATATRSISVDSIQLAEGSSLLFGSGKVSIATSLINQGFITLYGTTLSAASISVPAPGEIDIYDKSSITSPMFSNTGTVSVGTGGTLQLAASYKTES